MKEFEYKVGDIVYCYNDLISSNDNNIYKKENCYKIKDIEKIGYDKDIICIRIYNEIDSIMYVENNQNINQEINELLRYYSFYIFLEQKYSYCLLFYDYFFSKQQHRKLKLKQLSERV